MASGEWHVEKRASVQNESFTERGEPENSLECGSLFIIVLGASGDLAKKKNFPTLFNLYRQGFLPPSEVHIFGYARTTMTDDDLRDRIRGFVLCVEQASEQTWLST